MRLFFALPLPSEMKEKLRPTLDEARKVSGGGVGFTKLEERKFRPHLTLARVRPQGEGGAKRALAVIPPGELARCTVRGACLMQSVLGGRSGATHTVVRMFPFR